MAQSFLRVPAGRIAVLIGPRGKTKARIERETKTKIEIDSRSGEISVDGKDGEKQHVAENIVKAIGRGFAPQKAMQLLHEDTTMSVIKLRDLLGKSEKAIKQKKARIIGSGGQVRNRIEKDTNCSVSIFGNTVAVIGRFDEIENAEYVINSILEGANISTAFEMLKEKKMEEKKFEL
ncbi:MAG: KH domain-containing protein [Candidatus Diapherotrites archaeon]|nr:KH domain-containing protein [Candidatus Diapherotrites archaeon]